MSTVNYSEKYKCLKRKMKILVYEQETLMSELEKLQSSLLKVSQDNSFLLDNLMQYEHVTLNSPVDSDATISSDSELDYIPVQKKRVTVKQVKTENIEIENDVNIHGEKSTANEPISKNEDVIIEKNEELIILKEEQMKETKSS